MSLKIINLNKLLLAVLFISSGFGFSKNSNYTPKKVCETNKNSKYHAKNQILSYNAPARIDVQAAWDFQISASFIYWQPDMLGLDFGLIDSTDLSQHPNEAVSFHADYYPGFKIMLGTHYNYDNWNTNARYTRFHAKEKETKTPPYWANGLIFDAFGQNTYLSFMQAKWTPKIDYFDLETGRPFYSGQSLVLKPYLSVRGGFSKHVYRLRGTANNVTQEAFFKTKSWFLGPRAAFDINWLLGYSFRFFANSSISLMYQKLKTEYRFTSAFNPLTLTVNLHSKSIQLTPNVDVSPGIGWGSYFDHNNWHLDVYAAYNFIYFWNQNEFMGVEAFRNNRNFHATGDLMLHGFELTMRIDF